MTEVNLLPEEEEKRSFFKNYASLLPKVNLVITVIFFATVLVFVALFVVNQRTLTEVQKSESEAKNAVQAMATTEVQYTFLKDRALKAGQIFSSRDLLTKMDKLTLALLSGGEGSADLKKVEISTGRADATVSTTSFSSLNLILTALGGLDFYKKGTINSLGFNPANGLNFEVSFGQ